MKDGKNYIEKNSCEIMYINNYSVRCLRYTVIHRAGSKHLTAVLYTNTQATYVSTMLVCTQNSYF